MARSKNIGPITLLFSSQVFKDHMDICDIKYLPGNESKEHRFMYRSITLIDRFVHGLLRVHVEICDVICPIFSKSTMFDDHLTRIPLVHRWKNNLMHCKVL